MKLILKIFYLSQSIQNININVTVNNSEVVMRYFIFEGVKSSKSSVYFTLTAHCNRTGYISSAQ